jgi:MFS family permease
MLAGRLSDIFGRRWFFIVGSVIGLAGSIIGGTSQGIGQLIAGETLIGIAAGFQISFFWVVSEIVPMKRRFLANAGIFLWSLPTAGLFEKALVSSVLTIGLERSRTKDCNYDAE